MLDYKIKETKVGISMACEIRKFQNVVKIAPEDTSNPYKMQRHRDPKSKHVSNYRPL